LRRRIWLGSLRRTIGADRTRGWRQSRDALHGQDCQVEHAEANRYREKPSVQLAGDPVEAEHVLFHPRPRSSLAINKHTLPMLRCNIKTGKALLKFWQIRFALQSYWVAAQHRIALYPVGVR
jgi:hypothetical protein